MGSKFHWLSRKRDLAVDLVNLWNSVPEDNYRLWTALDSNGVFYASKECRLCAVSRGAWYFSESADFGQYPLRWSDTLGSTGTLREPAYIPRGGASGTVWRAFRLFKLRLGRPKGFWLPPVLIWMG